MSDNLLADLGIELGAGAAADAVVAETAAGAAVAEKAKRAQIDVGTIVLADESEDLPALVRTFTGERKTGSKYKFADIAAPVLKDETDASKGFKYFTMQIDLGENDPEAFRRSVQSATTQANNAYKTGEGDAAVYERKFVTRSFNVDGKFAGMKVYRVDNTMAAE